MDSAFQLCNIQNLIVLANKDAKQAFIDTVYPHNIDCIVLTKDEAKEWSGNYKVMFFGCFVEELKDRENIIMDEFIFKQLFKSLVRPHLEYAAPVWSPHNENLKKLIENVQKRATKRIPGFSDLSYPERLRRLNMPTLAYRRLRGDMIHVFNNF